MLKSSRKQFFSYMATLIETGMDGGLNISFFAGFPSVVTNNAYYMIKFINVVNELELTNEKNQELYNLHESICSAYNTNESQNISIEPKALLKYFKLGKEIIHDLRYSTEVLLLLTSRITKERRIDSTGKYIEEIKKGRGWHFDSHLSFFELIRKLDNSNKHHFTNDLVKLMGDDPSFCVYYRQNNWDESELVEFGENY